VSFAMEEEEEEEEKEKKGFEEVEEGGWVEE